MTKVKRSHGSLNITQKLCCLGFLMVCQVPPIRMGAVSQPCSVRYGRAGCAGYVKSRVMEGIIERRVLSDVFTLF